MTDTDLKPCPFCGGAMKYSQEPNDNLPVAGMYYLYHEDGPKNCPMHFGGHFDSFDEMAERWNTRAPAHDKDLLALAEMEVCELLKDCDLAPVVKPLEWSDGYGDIWEAMPFDCDLSDPYRIEKHGSGFVWFTPFDVCQKGGSAATLEEAKAAAQADYERRILSAIDTGEG